MQIKGTYIRFPHLGGLEILKDHLLDVDDGSGIITHFGPADSLGSSRILQKSHVPTTIIPHGSFVMPNFCDLHLHAPQFMYQGNGLHLPLMKWLDEYAFKAEEGLDADPELAQKVYTRLARRLIENGTGTVLLFGTIKEETNLVLARVMQEAGIRAFVGKLSMDMSSRPTYVESSTEGALRSASSFVERCHQLVAHLPKHRRLVEPVVTPRFVPTCSEELLKGLGELAESKGLHIQSHLAESHDQVNWVRHERGTEDVEVFDRNHLLTERTIQAHCTFLSEPDLSHVAMRGTSIVHCPLSNAYFSAEPFRLREALQAGVTVGLGTDIAGGYSVNMMDVMRQAVIVSRMREGAQTLVRQASRDSGNQLDTDRTSDAKVGGEAGSLDLNWKESLYLATRGGVQALGLPLGSGNFEIGTPFDAQQILLFDVEEGKGVGALDFFDLELSWSSSNNITSEAGLLTEDMVEKWWCIGDGRNRVGMWVQGDWLVSGAPQ